MATHLDHFVAYTMMKLLLEVHVVEREVNAGTSAHLTNLELLTSAKAWTGVAKYWTQSNLLSPRPFHSQAHLVDHFHYLLLLHGHGQEYYKLIK